MSTSKPTASQREKFRKIVERSGIIDFMTKTLVELYEMQIQEPEDALDFFQNRISHHSNKELEIAKVKIQELEAKLALYQIEKS